MEPGLEGNTKGRKTMNAIVTAQGWFNLGERVPYDRRARKMLRPGDTTDSPDVVQVFQRVVRDGQVRKPFGRRSCPDFRTARLVGRVLTDI